MIEEEQDEPLELSAIFSTTEPAAYEVATEADYDEEKEKQGPSYIIDSSKTGLAGGVSGRALVASMARFGRGENTWVRQKSDEEKKEDGGAKSGVMELEATQEEEVLLGEDEAERAEDEAVTDAQLDDAARATTTFRKAAFDIDIDGLEDRPWTRPDADPSDYFNYGMIEDSWRKYRQEQLELRRELQERRSRFAAAEAAKNAPQPQPPMPPPPRLPLAQPPLPAPPPPPPHPPPPLPPRWPAFDAPPQWRGPPLPYGTPAWPPFPPRPPPPPPEFAGRHIADHRGFSAMRFDNPLSSKPPPLSNGHYGPPRDHADQQQAPDRASRPPFRGRNFSNFSEPNADRSRSREPAEGWPDNSRNSRRRRR